MSTNANTPQPDKASAPTGATEHTVLKAGPRRRSSSAQGTLRWRAIESLRPEDERICYDPVASKLMGPFWSCLNGVGFLRRRSIRQLDSEESGMANWIIGRTKFIDDFLKEEVEGGIKQLVILGAGYDTRAYRFSELQKQAKVFELDDMATLKFKFARVRIAVKPLPQNVVFVPIDFTHQKLEDKLPPRIYDRSLKTMFIWEGVTMYLPAESVDQTLAFIAGNSGQGSSVVLDYLFESVVDGTSDLTEAKKLRQTTAQAGEPLLFEIKEASIEEFLSSRGFDVMQNLSAKSLKDAYFKGKGQQRKVFPLIAIVIAKVRQQ